MEKISINLLPSEYSVKQKQKDKWSIVQTLSVGFLLLLIFFASVIVALRILQAQNISQARKQTEETEQRIASLKGREATLVVLKNRVEAINQILKSPSRQTSSYNLTSETIPSAIVIDSISIDQAGNVLITATAPNGTSLEDLLSSLMEKLNSKAISKVEIESLSRGRDGQFRTILSLKVKV